MYKKTRNSGFTLVELMVVMAIIAILATAGISQYSKFIGKARDTARIADIRAIETAIISYQSTNSATPTADANTTTGIAAVVLAGTGKVFKDAKTGTGGCLNAAGASVSCGYVYRRCDGGGGYMLSVTFENRDNVSLYAKDGLSTVGTNPANSYDVGTCNTAADLISTTTITL